MNNKLKKDTKTKQADYQRKYMTRHTTVCVHFDNDDDKDIIRWLGKQKNRSEAIRRVIREAIR